MHKIVNTLHSFYDNTYYENTCEAEFDSRIYLKVKDRRIGLPHIYTATFYKRLANICDSYVYKRYLRQN